MHSFRFVNGGDHVLEVSFRREFYFPFFAFRIIDVVHVDAHAHVNCWCSNTPMLYRVAPH